jgi:hypothetical protein
LCAKGRKRVAQGRLGRGIVHHDHRGARGRRGEHRFQARQCCLQPAIDRNHDGRTASWPEWRVGGRDKHARGRRHPRQRAAWPHTQYRRRPRQHYGGRGGGAALQSGIERTSGQCASVGTADAHRAAKCREAGGRDREAAGTRQRPRHRHASVGGDQTERTAAVQRRNGQQRVAGGVAGQPRPPLDATIAACHEAFNPANACRLDRAAEQRPPIQRDFHIGRVVRHPAARQATAIGANGHRLPARGLNQPKKNRVVVAQAAPAGRAAGTADGVCHVGHVIARRQPMPRQRRRQGLRRQHCGAGARPGDGQAEPYLPHVMRLRQPVENADRIRVAQVQQRAGERQRHRRVAGRQTLGALQPFTCVRGITGGKQVVADTPGGLCRLAIDVRLGARRAAGARLLGHREPLSPCAG